MKTLSRVLAVSCLIAASAHAQQAQVPKDGSGLLDYCSHVTKVLDSPTSENSDDRVKFADNMMKFGWCSGYLQAIRNVIDGWRIGAAVEIMAAKNSGKPTPVPMSADQDFVDTCIPERVSVAQLARALVKWLQDHPERLHEPESILARRAFKDSFPCQANVAAADMTRPQQ